MKILKFIGVALLIALIILQFYPTQLNESNAEEPADITRIYDVPENIRENLKVSCYDCHSNNTRYPWYNRIQPIALYLEDHIEHGKSHLNFSEFGDYSIEEQKEKLEEMIEEVEEGEMPLSSYTLIHRDAKLSETERKALIAWANQTRDSI